MICYISIVTLFAGILDEPVYGFRRLVELPSALVDEVDKAGGFIEIKKLSFKTTEIPIVKVDLEHRSVTKTLLDQLNSFESLTLLNVYSTNCSEDDLKKYDLLTMAASRYTWYRIKGTTYECTDDITFSELMNDLEFHTKVRFNLNGTVGKKFGNAKVGMKGHKSNGLEILRKVVSKLNLEMKISPLGVTISEKKDNQKATGNKKLGAIEQNKGNRESKGGESKGVGSQ